MNNIKPNESMGLTPQRELEMSRFTWKAFLAGHADDCDTDAVVDLIVDETASIVDKQARQDERKKIMEIVKEYGLESASARDDSLERRAKGWQELKGVE